MFLGSLAKLVLGISCAAIPRKSTRGPKWFIWEAGLPDATLIIERALIRTQNRIVSLAADSLIGDLLDSIEDNFFTSELSLIIAFLGCPEFLDVMTKGVSRYTLKILIHEPCSDCHAIPTLDYSTPFPF